MVYIHLLGIPNFLKEIFDKKGLNNSLLYLSCAKVLEQSLGLSSVMVQKCSKPLALTLHLPYNLFLGEKWHFISQHILVSDTLFPCDFNFLLDPAVSTEYQVLHLLGFEILASFII